jgi:hypothetical protein
MNYEKCLRRLAREDIGIELHVDTLNSALMAYGSAMSATVRKVLPSSINTYP